MVNKRVGLILELVALATFAGILTGGALIAIIAISILSTWR